MPVPLAWSSQQLVTILTNRYLMQQGLHFGVADAGLPLQACHLGVILMCVDCCIHTIYQVCEVDACAAQGAAGLE